MLKESAVLEFERGRTSVEYEPRNGRSEASKNQKVHNIVSGDRSVS